MRSVVPDAIARRAPIPRATDRHEVRLALARDVSPDDDCPDDARDDDARDDGLERRFKVQRCHLFPRD